MGIEEHVKQKFVKHICTFLEAIQCHLEGGFFGDWSLENYVEKTIKNRCVVYARFFYLPH